MHISRVPRFLKEKRKTKPRKKSVRASVERGDTETPKFKARMLEADLGEMSRPERKKWFSDKRGTMQAGVAKEVRARSSMGHETRTPSPPAR